MLLQIFLIVLCPHEDKLVLRCIKDIIMDFLSRKKFNAIRIREIESFY